MRDLSVVSRTQVIKTESVQEKDLGFYNRHSFSHSLSYALFPVYTNIHFRFIKQTNSPTTDAPLSANLRAYSLPRP